MKLFFATIALAFGFSTAVFANSVEKAEFKWAAEKNIPGKGHTGKISLKSNSLVLKGDMVESGEFVFDMNSIAVSDLEGKWADKFLGHIKSSDFFDVEKYPTAKIELMKQMKAGEVEGKLTIKDKTNPIKVTFTRNGKNYKGKVTFDRTQFGIIYGSGNFFKELTADKIIKNEVDFEFDITAK